MSTIRGRKRKYNISLRDKVTILIIAAMLLCAILWTGVMFFNIQRNANNNAFTDEQSYMQSVESNVKSVEEVCNLAKQIVSQNYALIEYIKMTKKGEDLDPVEKISFYNNEISSIETMTNINPYLYQVRLFVNSDITEKRPCLYKIERMKNMTWSKNIVNNKWNYDYVDKVFPDGISNTHLAGILDEIRDDDGELLAVLEVTTKMDSLFMNFYRNTGSEWTCFLENDGRIYSTQSQSKSWKRYQEQLLQYVKSAGKKEKTFFVNSGNKRYIVSVLPMSSLEGALIHVRGTEKILNSYYRSQIPYILVVLVSMIIFVIGVIFVIKSIFKRFDRLTFEVNKITNGQHIKLTEQGNDEISDLSRQINAMISSLETLNKENTARQLLVKNAEIKSLQNQINAHFMYNVLETIKMMAEIKEDYEISDAVTSLGEMFRYSMKWTSGMVELSEEIKYIKNYLNLLNLRFDYEIFLSLNIPKEFSNLQIPKMSLQPLVENSVYHGIENMAEDTYIYIKAFKADGIIHLEVSDAGVGMSETELRQLRERLNSTETIDEGAEHGRALYNVQQRIKMYFGNEYGLQIFSKEGVYTKVLIQIPESKERKK